MNDIIITISTGRTGSVYLYNLIRANYACKNVFHELVLPHDSKTAIYHRCFDDVSMRILPSGRRAADGRGRRADDGHAAE